MNKEAEKTKADLLDPYSYSSSKGSNGARRHNNILEKLEETTSRNAESHSVSRKIKNFCLDKFGAKLDPNKPLLLENGSIVYDNQENNSVFSRILKFGRSKPRRATITFGTSKDCADICGVALGHGCVCTRPPVEGRKRCSEHKGMRINGSESNLNVEHKSAADDIREDPPPICGFTSDNSHVCTSQVVPGRRRCEEHKGKKIKQKSEVRSGKTVEERPICGMNLDDGTFCTEQAPIGRKRCEEHKGRKMKHQFVHSRVLVSNAQSRSPETVKSKEQEPSIPSDKAKETGSICGVNLEDGTFCIRSPVEGRKRCAQHKGMRVTSIGSPGTSTSIYDDTSASSNMCGAGLGDGSICRRVPVRGRKRCEQHKGMRAVFW